MISTRHILKDATPQRTDLTMTTMGTTRRMRTTVMVVLHEITNKPRLERGDLAETIIRRTTMTCVNRIAGMIPDIEERLHHRMTIALSRGQREAMTATEMQCRLRLRR